MCYDIAIIGAGICGLSAAIEARLANKNFVVLEKDDRIGGHEYTLHIKGKIIDIAFLFDSRGSVLHEFVQKKLNIKTVEHRIVYTSSFQNNKIIHDNTKCTQPFDFEINRLYNLTKNINLGSPYIIVTCEQFLHFHNFSKEFINFVLKPAISILFLSGNEIGMKKPIPVIAIFLHKVISLMTTVYDPVLWGIVGTEKISKQIALQFDINKHIMKQTAVKHISKGRECWILEDDKGINICAKKVIFCCDTIETNRICKNIFSDFRFFFIKKYIQYCNSLFEKCYACVHDYKDILPQETILKKNKKDFPYHYTYFEETKWILSGVLDENMYLSVSLDKELLYNKIPNKHILFKKKWRHPGQNTFVLALVNSGILRNRNYQNLFFSGAGTYMIGHTYAYEAGRKIGKLAIKS